MALLKQSLFLLLSFLIVFIWQKASNPSLTVPALGFLIFLYLLASRGEKIDLWTRGKNYFGISILNTIILLLIFSTGSTNSPLFFLLYFLVFGIAFVLEPAVVIVFVIGIALIFMEDILKQNTLENLIKFGSFMLIAPLAFFFGREFKRRDKEEDKTEAIEERARDAADTISTDVDKVLKDEKQTLKKEDVERLNEILEETESLREEAKE